MRRFIPSLPRSLHDCAQWLILLLPITIVAGKAPADIVISLVSVLFVIHTIRSKDIDWLRHEWVRVGLLFWFLLLIGFIWSENIEYAFERSIPWIRYLLLSASLAFWVVNSDEYSRKLMISSAIAIGFLVFDCWLQYLSGNDLFGREIFADYRLTGPYRRPRVGATIAWMMFPLLTVLIATPAKHWNKQLMKWGAASVIVVTIFITGERSAFMLTLFGLGLIALCYPNMRKTALLGAAALMILVGALSMVKPELFERQIESTKHVALNLSDSPYGQIWLDTLEIFVDYPLLGVGPKNYRVECFKPGRSLRRDCELHSHNYYLEILVENGLVGLGILLLFFISVSREFLKRRDLWTYSPLFVGCMIGFYIRLFPFMPASSFFASWNIIPMYLMIGWGIGISRINGNFQN